MTCEEDLWPSAAYHQQVEQLRSMVGQPLYVVEINMTDINAGVHFSGKPLVLLAIVDFPSLTRIASFAAPVGAG